MLTLGELLERRAIDPRYAERELSESGAATARMPGDPRGTVGALPPEVKILDAQERECPPARVDESGALLNYDEAVGEIVDIEGRGHFESYYKNPTAAADKVRGGATAPRSARRRSTSSSPANPISRRSGCPTTSASRHRCRRRRPTRPPPLSR
jgi:hypothetical protein